MDRNQKIACDCGGSYTLRNQSTHFKTSKHNVQSLDDIHRLVDEEWELAKTPELEKQLQIFILAHEKTYGF